MFYEFELEEIDLLVIQLRKILFENYQEVKKFEEEFSDYVLNHPSGNWYEWKRNQIKDIESKHGDLIYVRKFIDAVTKNEFSLAEKYYTEAMGVYHSYNTNKEMDVLKTKEFKSVIESKLQS